VAFSSGKSHIEDSSFGHVNSGSALEPKFSPPQAPQCHPAACVSMGVSAIPAHRAAKNTADSHNLCGAPRSLHDPSPLLYSGEKDSEYSPQFRLECAADGVISVTA
jgi:hypothetical protein